MACNNTYTYWKLQKCKAPQYYKRCRKKSIPFSEVTDHTFKKTSQCKELISSNLNNYFSDDKTQVSEEFGKK